MERKKAKKTTKKKPLSQKSMTKQKKKEKVVEKERMEKARRKRLEHAIIVELRGTSKTNVGRKIHHKCLRSFEARKQKKWEWQLKKSIFCQSLIYVMMSVLEEEVPTSFASWSGTLTSLLNTPLRSRLRLP